MPNAAIPTGALSALNGKQKKSISVSEVENGFVVSEHWNGSGYGGQHIAADLDAAHEIIKAYFAKE
jgi:hypothetical protein